MEKIKGFDLVIKKPSYICEYIRIADLRIGLFDRYMSNILFDKQTKVCYSCRNDYSCEAIGLLNEYLENGVTNMRNITRNELYDMNEPAIAVYRKGEGIEEVKYYILKNKHMSKIESFSGFKLRLVANDVLDAVASYADKIVKLPKYQKKICFFSTKGICLSTTSDFSNEEVELVNEYLTNGTKNLQEFNVASGNGEVYIETSSGMRYTKRQSCIDELNALIAKYGYTNVIKDLIAEVSKKNGNTSLSGVVGLLKI